MAPAIQLLDENYIQNHGPITIATMEEIKNLVDVGAMTRLLHETIAREREIENELELSLSQKHELERKILGLHKAAEVLELVRVDADQMLDSVNSTSTLAEHVSGKVRELDVSQSRVQETITRIDAIVNRTSCIDGVSSAIDSEDYESAAKYVHTFLQLDKDFSTAPLSSLEGQAESALEQRRLLLESKAKLEEIIREKFKEASENKDQPNVEKFAKIFVPLGLSEEGLNLFVTYLRQVVSFRAKQNFEALLEALDPATNLPVAPPDFVNCLTNLLRDVALAIESNEELLRELSPEEGVNVAVSVLLEEVDFSGSAIIKLYSEVKKLGKLAKDISSNSSSGVVHTEGPNLREIEILLEEMLIFSKRSEDFSGFVLGKLRDSEIALSLGDNLKGGAFSRGIQEIMSHYVFLEEFFMVENVRKAIRIDEAIPDALTTSMVDDVFYILQNSSRRAISTANVHPVLASLNNINTFLNGEFKEALLNKLREPNLASRLFSVAGGGVPKTGAEITLALNNADVSAEYSLKLRQDIDENCQEVFPAHAEREKLKSCLNDLTETSNGLRQLASLGLDELCKSITPRLRVILDSVGSINYELTEQEYSENELNDPWVQKLLVAVESSVAWLQPLLTSSNYEALLHLVIDFVVKRLEILMTQKKFNQLGGLQLDRDCRTLLVHFSGMSSRTVRDKFARLTQMAQILNLEKVSEILDYWGENSGPTTWRLTPAEVRRVLGLRVDFNQEAIASLRL